MNSNCVSNNPSDKNFRIMSLFPLSGLADPHALVDGDDVYVICGHDKTWDAQDTWLMDRWEILHTKDLVNWEKVGIISPKDTYIGDLPNCWAGNLKKKNGKYYWFFSNKFYNIGVMVSDKPEGPYKDALGRPMIEGDIVKDSRVYDPTVYVEDGEYYMVFGNGIYHIAKLNDDLLSLAEDPKPIKVVDENGQPVRTGDKSTLFKRNGIYYLVWGGHYAMSNQLFGTYIYKGVYGYINHNDFFYWKNRWYMVSEFPETSHFFRGVSVMAVDFNEDGTLCEPPAAYPKEKIFDFSNSTIGWHGVSDVDLRYNNEGYIECKVLGSEPVIESVLWPGIRLNAVSKIEVIMQNNSSANEANIKLAIPDGRSGMFKCPYIDWNEQISIDFSITSEDNNFSVYNFEIPKKFDDIELKRVRLSIKSNSASGCFRIKKIRLY